MEEGVVVMGVAMVEADLEVIMEAITEVVASGVWEGVAPEAFQAPEEEDTEVMAEALEEWVEVLEGDSQALPAADSAVVEGAMEGTMEEGMEGLGVVASEVQGEVVVDGKPFHAQLDVPSYISCANFAFYNCVYIPQTATGRILSGRSQRFR